MSALKEQAPLPMWLWAESGSPNPTLDSALVTRRHRPYYPAKPPALPERIKAVQQLRE
jgi:hypothetical protein